MLGKGGVGGGGGTKAPKPSFVSYVRPEVRERRRASAVAGGAAGVGALPARVPGGAERRDALGPPGGPRPGPLRLAVQVLGQGPGSRYRAYGREPESGRSCGPGRPRYPEGRGEEGLRVGTPEGFLQQPAAWWVCSCPGLSPVNFESSSVADPAAFGALGCRGRDVGALPPAGAAVGNVGRPWPLSLSPQRILLPLLPIPSPPFQSVQF